MSEKDFDFYQKELDEAMRNIAEPVPFVHLTGCDGGPWDFSVTFSGDRQCWRCQTANNAYQQGQQDMLAKCIAALEVEMESETQDRVDGLWDAIVALRALQDKS